MADHTLNIAIIGAGIGGLAAASLLRSIGHQVRVFEQAGQFGRVGAGIQMTPNAMQVLRRLGLEPALRAIAYEPEIALSREFDSGRITNQFAIAAAMEHKYGAPFFVLHRADLHGLLAADHAQDSINFGKKLVSLEQDSREVRLRFADGSVAHADLVVAADGVHSLVNTILFGRQDAVFTGRVAYRTTFPAALLGSRPLDPARTKWWGPDRHIVMYYVTAKRDEIYFVTSQPEDAAWLTQESWSAKGNLDELRSAFSEFHPDVQHVLQCCPDVHKWGLFIRDPLARWSNGRVVLLGDACHPMPPYMAQGAASALEDAAVLSRCVATMVDNGPAEMAKAFDLYEGTRKPRASRIQAASGANNWMRHASEANPDWVYGYNPWKAPLVSMDRAISRES
ncbi:MULTISPECIES: FAD-dependent monooxygenase [Pigmentiphaga]|uniref:FAD-dependent monooxygenase n=1 Tax=Pigmentiphaga daeguensis TaxID=414049 RepID=A0ABN1C8X5_9BURK